MRKNETELLLDWGHLQGKFWCDLNSRQACLHHHNKLQQNCHIFIHITQP